MDSSASTNVSRRYSDAQQRALNRLNKSKEVFKYSTQLVDDQSLRHIFGKGVSSTDGSAGASVLMRAKTAFEAAKQGSVRRLKQLIESNDFDVRSHDDNINGGGQTVLHYAAWAGHIKVLHYIINHVQTAFGEGSLIKFINCTDTVYCQSTALMEACRSNIGLVGQRLECITTLIEAGADANLQDASGDTCLHIAARNGFLPIVQYLTVETASALQASTRLNGRLQRPLDIAGFRCGFNPPFDDPALVISRAAIKKSASNKQNRCISHSRLTIFKILHQLLVGAQIRLKINAFDNRHRSRQIRMQVLQSRDFASMQAHADGISERSWNSWSCQRGQAEQLRKDELEIIRMSTRELIGQHFENFITSAKGKALLAKRTEGGVSEAKVSLIMLESYL